MPQHKKPYTSQDKWIVSIISALIALLVFSPFLYTVMNGLTKMLGVTIASKTGCPNLAGLLLHSIIFMLIIRALMR